MKCFNYLFLMLSLFWVYNNSYSDTKKDIGKMITIPAGNFLMGNSGEPNERFVNFIEIPQHLVYLPTYQIGKYEVTRGEYRKFIKAGGYKNKQIWSEDGWKWKETENRTEPKYWASEQDWGDGKFKQTENHPVIGVSFYEAEAFCKWAGGRLPTEAEWEKASRWDDKKKIPRVRPWGSGYEYELEKNHSSGVAIIVTDHANDNPAEGGHGYITNPVGCYPEEASPYGCVDMIGNAYEWCSDWYKLYSDDNPEASEKRCVRGGAWPDNYGGNYNRCAYRSSAKPELSWCYSGFRMAKDLQNESKL